MIALRLHTLAAAVAGAASLLAGAAHAGGHPCASAADCGGSYRPASAAYALTPPGPAYANAGYAQGGYGQGAYAQQGAYPAGYVGYDQASRGPVRAAPGYVGYEHASVGPAYAQGAYVQGGGYAQGGYAYGGQAVGYGGYPAPVGPDCATVCVPAYQVVQVAAPVETVQLASDVYTGGVGVTEISGGGGGGFNGNFEVQGFGDVSAFAAAHANAQADAVSYARSLSYAKASAEANANAYAKVYASAMADSSAKANAYANSSTNVNIKLNNSFYAKANFNGYNNNYNKGGYNKGGCDTCAKPQPVTCNTCGGSGGVGYGGGMGGWGKGGAMGVAPSPRGGSGCTTCGGGKHH